LEDDMVRDGKASLARRLSMAVSAGARRAIDRDGSKARRSTMEGEGGRGRGRWGYLTFECTTETAFTTREAAGSA
jgi:hypothetical protein